MKLLVVTAVDAEADAVRAGVSHDDVRIIAGGIGRTNAAAATTQAIVQHGRFDAVLNVGVAGALPGSRLSIGDALLASACVYAEEGIETNNGMNDIASMGLSLGDFEGNAVPVDSWLLDELSSLFTVGPIATVATCAGCDKRATNVQQRTGAMAEAMEGAAVVHAARRLRTPAIELRVISNTTGNRVNQQWNLPLALEALTEHATRAIQHLM